MLARKHRAWHRIVAEKRDGVGSFGEVFGACPLVDRSAAQVRRAGHYGRALRRTKVSGDRRTKLWLAATTGRRGVTRWARPRVSDAELFHELRRVLQPADMHVRAVAGMVPVPRLPRGTLVGNVGRRGHDGGTRCVALEGMGLRGRSPGQRDLFACGIAIVRISQQRPSRDQAETDGEHACG